MGARLRRLWQGLGRTGLAGVALLVFSAVYWLAAVAPARERLAELAQSRAELTAAAGARRTTAPVAGPAQPTPLRLSQATALLKSLDALARQHGLALEQATYALAGEAGQRRLEVTLPVRAAYPALRAYLSDVLAQPQAPRLLEANLQRPNANDPLLDATLRLAYPLVSE